MIRGKEGHGREMLDEVWGRDVFYHRIEPENIHYLQSMIALFRLVSNEEEGEETVAQFFSSISRNSRNVSTAIWGYECNAWMTREGEGKETTQTSTTLSPVFASPRPWDAKSNLLWTSPLFDHGHSGFSMSKTGHVISPSFSQTCFSSYTPHLLVSQNQSHILDAFIFIHCHIYHLIDLTNFSFKIFWVDKLLFFFLLNYCPGSDLHHLCPDLSSMSCPLSHSFLYLQCKSDPALTLLQILQWVSIMLSVK